jgi:thiol-disulfide isomerase/thioredoxin
MVAPHFQQLAAKHPNVIFCKVDVDEAQDIAANQRIQAMPTFKTGLSTWPFFSAETINKRWSSSHWFTPRFSSCI